MRSGAEGRRMRCAYCGYENDDAARFCALCGTALRPEVGQSRRRRRLLAGALSCGVVFLFACNALLVVATVPDAWILIASVVAALLPAFVFTRLILHLD